MSRCDWGFQDVISQSDDSASSVQTCIFNYLFYGVDNKKSSGRYVVYDIGGGTFDVSVLDFHEGISKELSKLANSLIIKHFFYKLIKKGRCVCAALSAKVGSISDNRLGGWYSPKYKRFFFAFWLGLFFTKVFSVL